MKCKAGDNECVRSKIQEIIKRFPHGNPDFSMPDISAFNFTNVIVSRASSNTPVQLNFKFLEFTAYGLENLVLLHTKGWTKDPQLIEGEIVLPDLKIIGDYETNGKILFLRLDGKGKGNVELKDCTLNVKIRLDLEKREDGKNYLKVKKTKVTMEPKKMIVKMDNLVKGSPELTNSINQVVNENWQDVWAELSDGINKVVAQIFYNAMTPVFNALPYDNFYVD
ncbi:protein takeout-like [Haematobia irritans]|uniref:protein takeout-like n=1 Tax=Haematobia irritans TaxID=7368 RepID=UPI003F50D416